MVMRLRYKQFGGHVHCRLFTAPAVGQTYAKCGDLVFSEEEWNDVHVLFECGGAEVLREDEGLGAR